MYLLIKFSKKNLSFLIFFGPFFINVPTRYFGVLKIYPNPNTFNSMLLKNKFMPAEWNFHSQCWMLWPRVEESIWRKNAIPG